MYSQKFFIFHQTYTTYFINIMYYYYFFFFQLSVWVDGLSSLLGKEVRTRNLFHPFSKVNIVLISWGAFFSPQTFRHSTFLAHRSFQLGCF